MGAGADAGVKAGSDLLSSLMANEQAKRQAEIDNEMKRRLALQSIFTEKGQLEANALQRAIDSLGKALLK